jgi:hypothetical protein
MTAVALPSTRAQSVIQRAYVYIVALVAVHMIVLGVANILRVLAELALGAPSGGFSGLPFLFADFNQPRDLYREQASLAIALLAVGTPAWWWHFRLAQRAAQAVEERASALRSLYIHAVVFVTALLVFGYGQRALRLVLQGTTFGSGDLSPQFFGLEAEWQARAAGAAAMALAASIALVLHVRLSRADRRATPIAGRAAQIRHLALYALVVVGFLFATFSSTQAISDVWRRVADAFLSFPPVDRPIPSPPPGIVAPPQPSRDDILRFGLLGTIPAIVAGLALWLGTWLPLQRGLERGPDVEIERRSVIRKLAIYLIVFISVVSVLFAGTITLADIGRRLLGDPIVEQFTSLWHDLGGAVAGLVIFAPMWQFHRRVVESEAARESEVARAATIRRLYTYLISAIGLAMAAIGTAGVVGVLGSAVLGLNTHSHDETATYAALVIVGGVAWAFHWRTAVARLDDDERRSLPRRVYLYLAVLGGVLGLLVFGSAALYRLLNAALALSFTRDTWHDLWHFAVDSTVAGVVAWSSFRLVRADRAALGTASEESYAVTVVVRAPDRAAARVRVASLVANDPDVSLKG